MRKGSTLFAITSFVRPSLEFEKANLYIPTIAIITAGSFEGIWGRAGRTSSMTCHLSMCSSNLPMQIRLFTLRRFGLIPALQSQLTSQKGGWWRCRGFLFLAIMQPSGSAGPRALHSTFGLRLENMMFYFRHQQMETTAKAYVSRITFIFSWEHVKYNNYFEFSNSSGKTILNHNLVHYLQNWVLWKGRAPVFEKLPTQGPCKPSAEHRCEHPQVGFSPEEGPFSGESDFEYKNIYTEATCMKMSRIWIGSIIFITGLRLGRTCST